MKTLKTRLDPIKDDVLKVVEDFGIFKAMDQFNIRTYDRFKIWLTETTGNEHYGLNPKINAAAGRPLGDQLVEAFLRKVSSLETKIADQDKQIRFLKWQLDQGNDKEITESIAILDACKV